jgi:2-haloalkanoic acid dehalogenase type II
MPLKPNIQAVAFDCFGTLIEYGDEQFTEAYGLICATQGLPIAGEVFFAKWMEVWRRLARDGRTTDAGTVAVSVQPRLEGAGGVRPGLGAGDRIPPGLAATGPVPPGLGVRGPAGPLAEPVEIPDHPEHHTPSAGRSRVLDGEPPPFRPYAEEWPEHFALCFEELGVQGDPRAAHEQLVELIAAARAFPESRRVVETLGRRLPLALMSNADDSFLLPPLGRNGLAFPVVLSSERARAYKPHVAIFEKLSQALGVPREDILYVGDSPFADVTGAKNAGLQAAWINRKGIRPLEQSARIVTGNEGEVDGARRPLLDPDVEIDSLDQLLDLIRTR